MFGLPCMLHEPGYGFLIEIPCWLLAIVLTLLALRDVHLQRLERNARQRGLSSPYGKKVRLGLALCGSMSLLLAVNSVWSFRSSGPYGEFSMSGGVLDFERSNAFGHQTTQNILDDAGPIRLTLPQFGSYGEPISCIWVEIPIWLLIVCSAAYTVDVWRRARRFVPSGHCFGCGYNLTGNTNGICPECGTAASAT